MYTSSATAYGFYPDNPVPMTEDSPLRGNGDFTYAKNKKEIEFIFNDFMAAHPDMAVTGNIERPGSMVSWLPPETGYLEDFHLEINRNVTKEDL